jgi:SAM-dependent methyltransferase
MQIHHDDLSDVTRYIENHRHLSLSDKEPHFRNLLAYVTRFTPVGPDTNMLEVGTGMGWFPTLCKKNGLRCRGLEISPQLVEFAQEYGRNCGVEPDIVCGNVEQEALPANCYDVIFCSSVFEHVEDWERGLRNVYSALKPGGILFFESTNKFSFTSGEYQFPLYGWLPNRWRYRLRMSRQGPDIMKNGIDFHQFTYIGLRRGFRRIGFAQYYDRLQLTDAAKFRGAKGALVMAAKAFPPLGELVLFFFEGTTFVCVK